MKFILSVVFAFLCHEVFSQLNTIEGKVLNFSDSLALPGAYVEIEGTTFSTTANDKGEFIFYKIPNGKISLKASYVGHSKEIVTVEIPSNKILPNFYLKPSAFDLEETVITGTRTEKILKLAPVLTQVITSKQINEMGVTSIEQALEKNVPGLDFSHLLTLTNITMQGMDAKYVLILIDGERVAGELQGNIDFLRLNTENIERIEIVKGASSVLYGSQAIGGVINIITKKSTIPLEVNYNSKFTTFNDFSLSHINQGITIGISSGRSSSMTNFVYNKYDGYNLHPENIYYPTQERFSNFSVDQKYNFKISEKFEASVYGNYYNNERFDASEIHLLKHPKYLAYTLGAKSKYIVNTKSNFEFSYYNDIYENHNIFSKQFIDSLFQKDKLSNVKLLYNLQLTNDHNITLGSEYLNEYIFSERVSGKTHNTDDYTLYCQEDWNFRPEIEIVGGIRLNLYKGFEPHLTPKISILYKKEPFNFRLSLGTGYRTPTLKERYIDFDHFGWWTNVGNPDLKPESSKYISVSSEYNSSFTNAIANIYLNTIKDMIGDRFLDTTATIKYRQYQNINKATVTGFDLILKFKISNNISANSSYSFVYSKNHETNVQLFGTTRNSANVGVNYNYRLPNYMLTININDKVTGQKYYDKITNIDPAFSILNFSFVQKFYSKYSLTLGVDNVLNHIELNSYDCITPGRMFFVQAIVNLKQY